MPLGRLIVQLCALFIAGVILVAGYAWFRANEVNRYVERAVSEASLPELMAYWGSAPAMTCFTQHTTFDTGERSSSWHYQGMSRFDHADLSSGGRVVHMVARDGGLYVWDDGSEHILRFAGDVDLDTIRKKSAFSDVSFTADECSAWWSGDERPFDIPANRPLIEYEG